MGRIESDYNDGKGLMISATLYAQLPPLKPGDKRRSNAKAPVLNKVAYVHENSGFIDMMIEVIRRTFRRGDLLVGGLDDDGRLQPDTPFTLEYTIPHNTAFKNIELVLESDWDMFVEKMKDTARANGKLIVREKTADEATQTQDAVADNDIDTTRKKKKKKHEPTDEEVEQTEIIKRLTTLHMCEDRKCTFSGPCWVDAGDSNHIHLTHLHLKTWAAAIEAKHDGVDDMHPPPTKLFDPTAANATADLATMARHRAASTANASAQNISISFDGLAELLRGPTNKTPPPAVTAPITPATTDYSDIPPMTLTAFCKCYNIPDQLKAKLIKLGVQGPQALCWIKDEGFCGEGFLLGEIGTLRDAEQRWKNFSEW